MTEIRYGTQLLHRLLGVYAEQGRTLESLSGATGRKVSTLKRHAKVAGAQFPDYRPRKDKRHDQNT